MNDATEDCTRYIARGCTSRWELREATRGRSIAANEIALRESRKARTAERGACYRQLVAGFAEVEEESGHPWGLLNEEVGDERANPTIRGISFETRMPVLAHDSWPRLEWRTH